MMTKPLVPVVPTVQAVQIVLSKKIRNRKINRKACP